MTDRRTFVKKAGALALGSVGLGVLGCTSGTSEETPGPAQDTLAGASPSAGVLEAIGLQLYTVRSLMEDEASVDETLGQISSVGYELVETAGLYDLDPQTVRGLIDAHGLRSPSGHYGLGMLRDDLEGTLATARALGQQYVVCPYLGESERGSLEAYRARAEEFNGFGERLQAEGLRFAYHNHDFEFETFGGEMPGYDLLLRETDPALVDFEMDLFWTYKAGYQPVDYFERYPGRFKLFHVKGGTAPPEREMVSVGEGAIDFPRIFAHAEEAGLEHAFVEHDHPEDPILSIRTSYQYLANLSV